MTFSLSRRAQLKAGSFWKARRERVLWDICGFWGEMRGQGLPLGGGLTLLRCRSVWLCFCVCKMAVSGEKCSLRFSSAGSLFSSDKDPCSGGLCATVPNVAGINCTNRCLNAGAQGYLLQA